MKGFLRCNDAILLLGPKITTVGRENCDITIQSPTVDQQHALIEFSEEENCYVLQDLNSTQGTYINDTRIQNAAVRLAQYDRIKFGYSGTIYQLELEDVPVQQKNWGLNSSISRNPYKAPEDPQGLPLISTSSGLQPPPIWTSPSSGTLPYPPANLRSRPVSAGTRKQVSDTAPPAVVRGSWVTPPRQTQDSRSSPTYDVLLQHQEKEQRMLRMGDEINKLTMLEQENERKTVIIEQLTAELTNLKQAQSSSTTANAKASERFQQLEEDLQAKKVEIAGLKDKVLNLEKSKCAQVPTLTGDAVPLQEYNDKLQELFSLRAELDRVRKDKNIISGLVNQTQRDMSTKDSSISRLARELEQLKKDIRNRDVQIATLTSKMSRVKQSSQSENDADARDKEIVGLRLPSQKWATDGTRMVPVQQLKNAENKVHDMSESLKTLKGELERKTSQLMESTAEQMRLQSEVQHCKAEFLDVQRAERAVRVDLEQACKKADRFRNRVIQVAFSTPGVKFPEEEVKDEDLMDLLKKMTDERTQLQKQITELKDQVKRATEGDKRQEKAVRAFKQHLADAQHRMKTSGLLSSTLKQELTLLQSVSLSEATESLQSIKETLQNVMQLQLDWQQSTEDALEKCGVQVKVSTDPPAKHIIDLYTKWELAIKDRDGVEANLKLLTEHHKAELATQAANFRQDIANKVSDALEKSQIEGEARLNRALDDLKSAEREKRDNAIEAERRRQQELENSVNSLTRSLLEQQQADKEKLESANQVLRQLDDYKRLEETLRKEIEVAHKQRQDDLAKMKEAFDTQQLKDSEELRSYKEQVKQHSLTICSMEERLDKAKKKCRSLIQENGSLKQKVQELQSKPIPRQPVSPPEKPKVIIQREVGPEVAEMQQSLASTRQECVELRKMTQEQQNVILALKRDLAGAEARLSDMNGEIPDAYKIDLERTKDIVRQKTKETTDLQQQLVKLSAIIDSKSASVKQADNETEALKSQLLKLEKEVGRRDSIIRDLEMKIVTATESHTQEAKQLEEDNEIKSELSTLGAACRGERHQLVIERQREALSELRRRIKELEAHRPLGIAKGGTQATDAALKQIDILKRELDEMRATNQVEERTMQELSSMAAVERAVNKARGITSAADAEVVHERSAHRETQETLDESEKSYLSLLRGVASCLDMEEVAGLKSLAHIPPDEQQKLLDQRESAAEFLTAKILALKERLSRKDELLRNYERDLAKLRQAELLVQKRSEQVEELVNDVQARLDETMYLRATLERTKDRLHQEKRLNTAIKEKKTFHLENEKGPFVSNRRHVCPPDDLLAKEAAKKKQQIEKIRRKNYEIKTLKQELAQKHTELCHTTTRLVNLENDIVPEDHTSSARHEQLVLS